MGIAKVIYGNNTLVDLTNDSVTAANLLNGVTAHAANGNPITGTYNPIDLSNDTVTPETLLNGYTAHNANGVPIVGTMEGGGDFDIKSMSITNYNNQSEILSGQKIIDDSIMGYYHIGNQVVSMADMFGNQNYITPSGDGGSNFIADFGQATKLTNIAYICYNSGVNLCGIPNNYVLSFDSHITNASHAFYKCKNTILHTQIYFNNADDCNFSYMYMYSKMRFVNAHINGNNCSLSYMFSYTNFNFSGIPQTNVYVNGNNCSAIGFMSGAQLQNWPNLPIIISDGVFSNFESAYSGINAVNGYVNYTGRIPTARTYRWAFASNNLRMDGFFVFNDDIKFSEKPAFIEMLRNTANGTITYYANVSAIIKNHSGLRGADLFFYHIIYGTRTSSSPRINFEFEDSTILSYLNNMSASFISGNYTRLTWASTTNGVYNYATNIYVLTNA